MTQSTLLTASYRRNTYQALKQLYAIFDTASGHSHDGTNSRTVTTSVTYGIAEEMAAAGTSTANAAGTTAKSARIDHVHALGTHTHAGATTGGNLPTTALAADTFTANAAGRLPFQDGWLSTAKLADGILSADAAGRAKMAAAFISADATGRAFFAANLFDATTLASVIADDAMTTAFLVAKVNDDALTNAFCDAAFEASAFAADADSRALFADGIWITAKLAAGILSADVTGRALIAAGYFDAATVLSAFANNSIPGSKVDWSYGVTPGNITGGDAAGAGASAYVARIDHVHGFAVAAPSGVHVPDCADAVGFAVTMVRSDHVHALACGAPVDGSLAAANAEGNGTSFARLNHAHRAVLLDSVSVEFGTTYDAVIGWQVGDASNETLVIGLADANQALHIADKTAIATDWNVGADTHPSLYIHSDTTPTTDYLKMWHDATTGYIASAGGTLDLTGVGAVTVNEASGDVDFRVETNNIANGFVCDAGLDAFGVGYAAQNNMFFYVGRPARTAVAGTTVWTDLEVAPGGGGTFTTENNTITYLYITSARFSEPNIVKGGGGTPTDTINLASTVYILNAPTEGVANYALYVAEGLTGVQTLTCAGTLTMTTQQISLSTGNITFSGAGYIAMGASPAASGYIRLLNTGVMAWRNAAGNADISALTVNAANDVAVGADLQLGGNSLIGATADNGDLTLVATTSGTVTTAYIITAQMLDVSLGGLALRGVAGAPGQGNFAQTLISGVICLDTTGDRLAVYYDDGGGAAFHYWNRDAGFRVESWERQCPVCGEALQVGDEVVGVLDAVLECGDLHGYYKHSACGGGAKRDLGIAHPPKRDITVSKPFPNAAEREAMGWAKEANELMPIS